MIVAVHQPTFLPWLGLFAKIAKSDVFIVLDDAAPSRGGSSWLNRVRLRVAGEARWVTAPVDRKRRVDASIAEAFFADLPWRARVLRTLDLNYRGSEHFESEREWVGQLVQFDSNRLMTFNLNAIHEIAARVVPVLPRFVFASDFAVESSSTQRLVDLVRAVGGTTYLAGDGAESYQSVDLFHMNGVDVRYNSFVPRPYPQGGREFIPGLSALDALLHVGAPKTLEMVAADVRAWRGSQETGSSPGPQR